jgi:hypothetical protein
VSVVCASSRSKSITLSIPERVTLIPVDSELLKERYGQKQPISPRKKLVLASTGVAALVAATAWFSFGGYQDLSHKDIGFRVIDQFRVEVDFELSKPPGAKAICSIQALNNSFFKVGWIELEFGESEFRTLRHTVALNTTELAVTGLVDSCRLR